MDLFSLLSLYIASVEGKKIDLYKCIVFTRAYILRLRVLRLTQLEAQLCGASREEENFFTHDRTVVAIIFIHINQRPLCIAFHTMLAPII